MTLRPSPREPRLAPRSSPGAPPRSSHAPPPDRSAGSATGAIQRACSQDEGITSAGKNKAQALSDRSRTPRLHRIAPIDAGEQVTHLRGRDRDDAVGRRRPQKAALLQPPHVEARRLPVVPGHLQKIAATPAEAEDVAAQRVTSAFCAWQGWIYLRARNSLKPQSGITVGWLVGFI